MSKDIHAMMSNRKARSEAAISGGLPDDPTNRALDREFDAMFCIATHLEDIVLVSLNKLYPYSKHPFKAYNGERLTSLADSIARDGLQQPVIVRKLDGKPGWEILAGHNRVEAMKQLGKQDIPAIVRILTDEQAALVVVETNLKQRDKLLPSEKAFAYKLQMEALQGENRVIQNSDFHSDSNGLEESGQIDHHSKTRDILAENEDETGRNIQRYIRLTNLMRDWLDKLDSGEVPVMAGYALSFLDPLSQEEVYRYCYTLEKQTKPTLKHAEAIRAAFEAGQPVTADTIPGILQKPKKKPGPVTYRFSLKELKKQYAIPEGFDLTALIHEILAERYTKT